MDHWLRSKQAFATLGSFADRQLTGVAAPFHNRYPGFGPLSRRLPSFWLAALLGSAAIDQSKADDGLAPQNSASSAQIPQLESAAIENPQDRERERLRSDVLQRELASVRTELEAARAQALKAQAVAEEQRELAARERAVNGILQQDFLALRKDTDAPQAEGTDEAKLRRELATAGRELALMKQVAEGLARDFVAAQSTFDQMKADAVAARDAARVSLVETTRKLEEERQKGERLERDLAAASQSIEALEAKARLAAIKQAGAMRSQLAEAGARQSGEALVRERERARSLATDLATARRERDAAREELNRIAKAPEKAWEQEHEKAASLDRELVAARNEIDALKGQIERSTSGVEKRAKATDKASARAEKRKLAHGQKAGSQMRKPRTVPLTTMVLPDELLPMRPPAKGFRQ